MANKARYAELARLGLNTKSKRSIKNNKRNRKLAGIDHSDGHCGNLACKKCFPKIIRIIHYKTV